MCWKLHVTGQVCAEGVNIVQCLHADSCLVVRGTASSAQADALAQLPVLAAQSCLPFMMPGQLWALVLPLQ
jgi:hypothetical protein